MSKATETKLPGSMDGYRYEHPAMVTVGFSRASHGFGGTSLFGSDVKHRHTMTLHISPATVDRHLSTDWVHGEIKPLIEVEMSPIQFAELLSSLNVGTGVPATLRYFDGKSYESPELPTKAEQFRGEVEESLGKVVDKLMTAQKEILALLEDDKPVGKKAKKEIANLVSSFEGAIRNHLPFILEQFQKQMAKTVVEAKSAVDAFVNHAIVSTGLEALRADMPKPTLIGYEEEPGEGGDAV